MAEDGLKSDLELVREVLEGNRISFSEIVRRHSGGLFRLAVRFTRDEDMAEDIVQESLIKAYEKLGSFENRSSFKTWLYQITVNTARNRWRDKRDRQHVDIDSLEPSVMSEDAVAEIALVALDEKRDLRGLVDQLPEKQKTALVLRVYEDLSFAEIARIMDCPYDTAKANYRHAIMKLRHHFEAQRLSSWAVLGQEERRIESN